MTTYTSTREYNTTQAHEHDFYLIDYDLPYRAKIELVERFADSIEYEIKHDGNQRPTDMIHQIIDEWLTTWDADIAQLWVDAKCPQPDIDLDYTTKSELPILRQMINALFDLASEFMYGLAYTDPTDELMATLVKINTIWPVTTN